MRAKWWASGLVMVALLLAVPAPALARHSDGEHVVVMRVAGSDRISTALRVGQLVPRDSLPCLDVDLQRCQGVIVASADGYADALAGGPLGSNHRSPVFLSPADRLPDRVATAIGQREARVAWVLGGHAALSEQIDMDLRDAGVERVIRLAGTDRFDTARRIALEIRSRRPPTAGTTTRVVVAAGSHPDPSRGWQDALAAAALAGVRPLLLVERDRLPGSTREALEELEVATVTIVGGTASVSAAVEAELRTLVDAVERIAGADRYETAWLAAQRAVEEGAVGSRLWLATGDNWPDALAAAPAITARRSVLLLTHPENLDRSVYVRSWVERYRDEFSSIRILGGVGAVGLAVEDELRRATEPCHPSYPDVCIGPPPPQLTCEQVGYRDFAVTGDDPHGFDPDQTGQACPTL